MCFSVNCFTISLVLIASLFYGLYINTLQTTPHVTLEQLHMDGAEGVHKGDRIIEYFTSGSKNGTPIFWIHRAGSTGRAGTFLGPQAEKYGFKVISLSLPGTGGTSPIIGRGYFEAADDILYVADHLGFKTFHVMGVSYGSGTAAAVAIKSPKRILSVQLIVPAWPSMKNFDFRPKEAGFMEKLNTWPFTDRIMAYYLGKLNLNVTDILRMIAPEDVDQMEKYAPDHLREGAKDYKRQNRYHHEGSCELSRVMRETGNQLYEKRHILQEMGKRVSIWYGTKDKIANPEGTKFLREMIPNAKVFPIEAGHLGALIDSYPFLKELTSNNK